MDYSKLKLSKTRGLQVIITIEGRFTLFAELLFLVRTSNMQAKVKASRYLRGQTARGWVTRNV